MEFINEEFIFSLIDNKKLNDKKLQRDIIEKSKEAKGLTLEECASLLQIDDQEITQEMFSTAKFVKEIIYGNRLVLFAPLYVTNACVNNCLYCAFRKDNKDLIRKTLSLDEIREETEFLVKTGHKRVLLVAGEHPKQSALRFIGDAVKTVYDANISGANIRRINVNTAPLSIDDFKELKSFEIGTYQCFQETYHYETYLKMHPTGPKKDYSWRLYAMDRALQSGIDDVGIGVLFGLTDHRFETLAMLSHAFNLDARYGIGPHTISIPRLEPAFNAPVANKPPYAVDDPSFKKLIAILRLAVPYTGIILSTRERAELRRELFELGVSQISAGSRTSPGSYKETENSINGYQMEQFQLGDHRTLEEVVKDCCSLGYLPSFCTACYRSDRTGDRFMKLAKTGEIGKICVPNALSTFKEYVNDFAHEETKKVAIDFIQNEIENSEDKTAVKVRKMIERIDNGERDVFF
ncbi:MAG: [FeFe] hydrogenase H-cluster radical SAM maturase HydG [Bacteroidetes bacterium]|nr:[FeFe] hydrogenase H-cluster radical SAM maturase HydG [Bacteroidota bacterium]MBU1681091.1 [FeFe] hydrogenase H-cluster radical SAM maturase HydG [Bacteroidota bacterium]